MNREIKFRVWCHDDEKMLDNDRLMIGNNGNVYEIGGQGVYPERAGDIWCQDMTVMLCTGFQDSEGREIYEGDILKFDTGKLGLVYWDSDRAGFFNDFRKQDGEVTRGHKFFEAGEVIGNSFENSELLEV